MQGQKVSHSQGCKHRYQQQVPLRNSAEPYARPSVVSTVRSMNGIGNGPPAAGSKGRGNAVGTPGRMSWCAVREYSGISSRYETDGLPPMGRLNVDRRFL